MADYYLLFFFFFVSIFFSFLCSVLEAALLSITPAFVSIKEQEGSQLGKDLRKFKEDIDQPLAAILTLNTIAHTVGAMGVGAMAGRIFHEQGFDLGFTSLSYESIIAAVMTLAILILSEIIPKTIGANSWKSLAPFTVKTLKIMIWSLWPLIWVSQKITKSMKKDKGKSVLSRTDFMAMADAGHKEGVFREGETRILKNLMRFETIKAKDIMTPRTVVLSASETQTIREFFDENPKLRFSRIPVFNESLDDSHSYILKDELYLALINQEDEAPLKKIARKGEIVQENTPIQELFNQLMEKREHIAFVMDEFGGMAGLVTMEDVIETLLGLEILDETDNVGDLQDLARKQWEQRAKRLGIIQ